jgi:hypothetical protein
LLVRFVIFEHFSHPAQLIDAAIRHQKRLGQTHQLDGLSGFQSFFLKFFVAKVLESVFLPFVEQA